jgi:hypothetical protein
MIDRSAQRVAIEACLDTLAAQRVRLEDELREPSITVERARELERAVVSFGATALQVSRLLRRWFCDGVLQ